MFEKMVGRVGSNIIAGDWNLVLDLDKDKKGGNYTTHKKAQKIVIWR